MRLKVTKFGNAKPSNLQGKSFFKDKEVSLSGFRLLHIMEVEDEGEVRRGPSCSKASRIRYDSDGTPRNAQRQPFNVSPAMG